MKNNNVSIYDDDYLKSKIYTIRGVQVMLDADLAEIYGYKTSSFNQQVKNNIERFDDEMRFQLTKEEHQKILISKLSISNDLLTNYKSIQYNEQTGLMSKILTSNNAKRGGTRKLPYAFTEQGIYMLMTVLKGDLAVDQSKKLIKLFKKMKDFFVQFQNVLPESEIRILAIQTQHNTEDIRQIKQKVDDLTVVVNDFTDPNIKKDYLFYNGQTVEADIAYSKIYSYAKKTINIVDNYISLKTLVLLKSVAKGVKVTIFSDNVNHGLHQTELDDFKKEYPNVDITMKTTGGIYHDRYIFIDSGTKNEMIFHCGGSSKDGGHRVSLITKVEDVMLYQNIINTLNSKIFSQKPLDNQKSFVFLQCLDRPGPRTLHYYALGG